MMCAILGCAAQVCLLAAVLRGSPTTVCPYPMSTAGGLLLWVVYIMNAVYSCSCSCSCHGSSNAFVSSLPLDFLFANLLFMFY